MSQTSDTEEILLLEAGGIVSEMSPYCHFFAAKSVDPVHTKMTLQSRSNGGHVSQEAANAMAARRNRGYRVNKFFEQPSGYLSQSSSAIPLSVFSSRYFTMTGV
jgi:hypothetical protein